MKAYYHLYEGPSSPVRPLPPFGLVVSRLKQEYIWLWVSPAPTCGDCLDACEAVYMQTYLI